MISREDLILSKLWWAKDTASEMQLRDVKNLMRSGFDVEYAAKRTDELGISESFENCRKELKN